ncbi:MAG: polysaccharide pyruvyl transferase CsaB [Armatimonadetes bacterium RBG_16_58_9]|nr:MAG: polysaccharide pyruvyl transferase CsaB [Armatimonadetes bacterium RBG_16_58_9]
MSKRIVISGYYGFGNAGDEAVLSGIIATLQEAGVDASVCVLSGNPKRTRAEHPGVDSVHRYKITRLVREIRKADLVISGGGSLLQDVTSLRSLRYYLFVLRLAQVLRRKTMIYAQGIGPLETHSARQSLSFVLNRVNGITVRDENSRCVLESIGVTRTPVEMSADPSFLVDADLEAADRILAGHGVAGNRIIGVSIRPWPKTKGSLEAAGEGIRRACDELGAEPVMILMQPDQDAAVCEALGAGTVPRIADNPRALKGIAARCSLVVGMRLHSLMFAASACVPFVSIVYDPKVESFAQATGQKFTVDMKSLSAEGVKSAVLGAWNERDVLKRELEERVPELRRLALKSGEMARELLGG